MDEHDQIADHIAEIFVSNVYVHTVIPGNYPYPDINTAEITSVSLKKALSLALSAFAREYGLIPKR